MTLGSIQPLTEMSTRNLPGGKRRPARKAYNVTAICVADFLDKMWEPRRLSTIWVTMSSYKDRYYTFTFNGSALEGKDSLMFQLSITDLKKKKHYNFVYLYDIVALMKNIRDSEGCLI
jgi:hypothetical protein